MRRAAKIDANQNLIVKQLRQLGYSVYITSMVGKGFPDLVIGKHNKNYLVELKDGSKPLSQRKLTNDEVKFIGEWQGEVIVAHDLDGILNQVKGVSLIKGNGNRSNEPKGVFTFSQPKTETK